MFAEMYERARSELPDEDPARGFEDRGVRLETTFAGAGVINGDLTPECAAVLGKVLDSLSAPGGEEDDRSQALVLNRDGTTTAWNKDKTKVLHSHGPPVRPG
jgi:hypothetical protein